jgi:hypothetical protein
MKYRISHFLFFALLLTVLAGCTLPQGKTDTNQPVNETALAIDIALNNSSVRAALTEPWTITDVNPDAGVTIFRNGEYVSLRTPEVVFDMDSRSVFVYVDLGNRSVALIHESPKRAPMPIKTQDNPSP